MPDQRFSHCTPENSAFVQRGLRSYFEYRDLGISDATSGAVVAHVIRAVDGVNATGEWHAHDCTFQMYYVLKGSITFEYEGEKGQTTANAGDCVLQPPGIRHREIEHSADLELIEVVSPADFGTRTVD